MIRRLDPGVPALVMLAAALLAVSAIAVLSWRSPASVSAAPACRVEFSLPAGSSAELRPGGSFVFPFSATVTTQDVQEVSVQIAVGPTSGLMVDIQPEVSTIGDIPVGAPQSNSVFGGITVSVPASATTGVYSVSGIGAIATCTATDRNGSVSTLFARTSAQHLTITVIPPEPTATPQPEPTSTPIPAPAVCEPGFSLTGASNQEASPGDQLIIPFEASVVARRVSQVTLDVVSTYQGSMQIAIEPASTSFSFDPLPADTLLRTFSGNLIVDVPSNQAAGSYAIDGFLARAHCQGVDSAGSPTTFSASSPASGVTVRVSAPAPTPEPTSTQTATPTATATAAATTTATASATATASPTTTATPSPTLTTTPRPSPAGTASAAPTATASGTATATVEPTLTATPGPTATLIPTSTPRSIVRLPVTVVPQASTATVSTDAPETSNAPVGDPATSADTTSDPTGATMLVWEESRALYAEESTERNLGKPLAAIFAALLVAAGTAGAYHSRTRGNG